MSAASNAGGEYRRVVVLGAGGHAKELLSYFNDLRASGCPIEVVGLLDDNQAVGQFVGGVGVAGKITEVVRVASELRGRHFITAFGDNAVRKRCVQKLVELTGSRLVACQLAHPTAVIGQSVAIGEGTCLAPGCVITTRVSVGKHCILNVRSSVSHDSEIGDFVNINPAATVCGMVKIGEGAYIGASATIIDHVSVGEWSVIGAGAVVIEDIPPNVTAVGVPARIIRHH